MKNSVFLLVFLFLALSININSQWMQVNTGMGNTTVNSLVHSGNNIFAGAGIEGTGLYGVFLSTNNGTTWTQTSLNNRYVYSLAVNGNYILAGIAGMPSQYGVYLSTNNGTSWTQTSLNNQNIWSLAASGNNIFAGTSDGVYKSTNNGTTWNQVGLDNHLIRALAINGNIIFAGAISKYGVHKSTDNGTTWVQTSLNMETVYSLTTNGNYVFAGLAGAGIFLSTNNGLNWSQTLGGQTILSLTASGNNIFSGAYSGVYVSSNNGTNWTQRNEGLPGNTSVNTFYILNNYIFAGTFQTAVYRRPFGELVGIQPISNEIPNQYSLSQNYPNPFNPSTNIKFQMPKAGHINLKIYDALGREVSTIVNEQLNPGTYEVDWDASSYSSGVYYYKLLADDYSETKKMILIK